MKLNTNNLKKMLSKMSKCKPNNLLEITQYYELHFHEDGFAITGTDGVNFIMITSEEGAQEEEAKIIVKADQFSKLISKMTSENVDLQVKADFLQVKGNGTYKCEIFTDEDYPDYEIDVDKQYRVSTLDLLHGLGAGKTAKSNSAADGVLFSYLLRQGNLIAADSIKVSYTSISGFEGEILIPPGLANLLSALEGERVVISVSPDKHDVEFVSNNIVIYGALAEGADEYPDVSFMFEDSYPYMCKVDTQATLQALDRLKLFVGTYDSGFIDLTFTDGALILSTLSGSNEIIPYHNKINELKDNLDYRLNGQYLQDLVSASKGATIELHFGEDDSIKIESEDDKFILATSDGDDE